MILQSGKKTCLLLSTNAPFSLQAVSPAAKKFYLALEPPPRSPHFIRALNSIGSVCGYRLLAKCSCPLTTTSYATF